MEIGRVYEIAFELPLAFSYVCRDKGITNCSEYAMRLFHECGGRDSRFVRPAVIGYYQFSSVLDGLVERGVRPRDDVYYALLGEANRLERECTK